MSPSHPSVLPCLCSAKTSKCHKMFFRFTLNRKRFIEEIAVPKLKSATQNLNILRTNSFSPASWELLIKRHCTVTFKVLNVPVWHFEAFMFFMDILKLNAGLCWRGKTTKCSCISSLGSHSAGRNEILYHIFNVHSENILNIVNLIYWINYMWTF